MTDGAFAAHIAVNRDVVRRVGEDELGFFSIQEVSIVLLIESIAAEDAMFTQEPQVAGLGDTRIR